MNVLLSVRSVGRQLWFGQLSLDLHLALPSMGIRPVRVFSAQQVLGRLDPWHAEVRRQLVGVAHHVVEADVEIVFDIAPFFVCEQVAEGRVALRDGFVAAQLYISTHDHDTGLCNVSWDVDCLTGLTAGIKAHSKNRKHIPSAWQGCPGRSTRPQYRECSGSIVPAHEAHRLRATCWQARGTRAFQSCRMLSV